MTKIQASQFCVFGNLGDVERKGGGVDQAEEAWMGNSSSSILRSLHTLSLSRSSLFLLMLGEEKEKKAEAEAKAASTEERRTGARERGRERESTVRWFVRSFTDLCCQCSFESSRVMLGAPLKHKESISGGGRAITTKVVS